MTKADHELEQLFRYRFIQVLYVVGLILSFCFIITFALIMCPEKKLNIEKSKVTCSDEKSYTFSSAGIEDPWNHYSRYFWQSDTPNILNEDKGRLEKLCVNSFLDWAFSGKYNIHDLKTLSNPELLAIILAWDPSIAELKNRGELISLNDIDLNRETAEYGQKLASLSIKNFSFAYDSPKGIWLWFVVLLFLLPAAFLYAFLNILRETLIYLFIGRKFTWQWLKFYR